MLVNCPNDWRENIKTELGNPLRKMWLKHPLPSSKDQTTCLINCEMGKYFSAPSNLYQKNENVKLSYAAALT